MSVKVFDKYEIIRRIAVGGMGEIFLARQTGVAGFDRLVILKSLLPDLAKEKGFIDQFLDEARVAATLNHPNIVAIYEVGLWQGIYFIAMEYIKGATVAELLMNLHGSNQRIPIPVAARVIMDAATALDHAHHARTPEGESLNIVHRDISPQNIMVRDDGVTKVVDFGIAKAANRAVRTATGAVKGKLTYMPPEQLGGKPVDGRSDQFALGICLWEMCAMERLFHADNPLQTVQLITQQAIPRLADKVDGFPAELDRIVARMLERDPDARYPRCRDAAQDLRRFLESQSREVAEDQISDFMQRALGDDIARRTQDLTPKQDDFLIHLRNAHGEEFSRVETPAEGTVEIGTSELRLVRGTNRSRTVKTLAALAAMMLAVLSGAWQMGLFDSTVPVEAPAPSPTPIPSVATPSPIPEPPRLELTAVPKEVEIWQDNRVLGRTPVELSSLGAGVHRFSFRRVGYDSLEKSVTLVEGETQQLHVELTKKQRVIRTPTKPPPQKTAEPADVKPGFLSLNTRPWTQVSIEGRHVGSTPLIKEVLPPGRYTLRLRNPKANIDERLTVIIRSGKTQKVSKNFGS